MVAAPASFGVTRMVSLASVTPLKVSTIRDLGDLIGDSIGDLDQLVLIGAGDLDLDRLRRTRQIVELILEELMELEIRVRRRLLEGFAQPVGHNLVFFAGVLEPDADGSRILGVGS
jgi:hypothetical protein